MPHGWLILDKPRGLGSTQAVAAVKRVLRTGGYGKVKIGHGGTLDPLAEGVLPVALGEATKLAGRMLDATKTYAFTIQFGEETDTLDGEGQVVATGHCPPLAAVAAILEYFTGPIDQTPPAYSALKVAGRRAYDRARAGEEVDLPSRKVTVHSLALLRHPRESGGPVGPSELRLGPRFRGDDEIWSSFGETTTGLGVIVPDAPLELADSVTLLAEVSKGTYIRSLARDIAHALGTVGHVTYLRRARAGPFTETHAISLDKLNEIGNGARLEDHLLPIEAGLDGIPALTLDPESAQAARQGRVLSGMLEPDGLYLATADNVPVALIDLKGGTAKVVRGFNLPDTAE
jgi:tRNA pseudouridine55 synthase